MKLWSNPTKENEAAAAVDLTFEFTREQYIGGLPEEVAATIRGEPWAEDWRVMNLPGRMETQRALIADYKNHAARFDAIAKYLKEWQPPALMLWGRHDPYFDIAETLSWMQDLPRMEAHIFDGGHFLLEAHAAAAVALMIDFIKRTHVAASELHGATVYLSMRNNVAGAPPGPIIGGSRNRARKPAVH